MSRSFWPLLVACLGLAGCADKECAELCEQAQDENCDDWDEIDCDDLCDAAENIAEKGDCQDDYDDWMACLNDADDDICDAAEDECDNEADQFEDCVQEYCADHPESSSCNDFAEAAG